MSEFEAIPLQQVFDMPVIQYLNDLSYLKAKSQYDEEQHKKLRKHAN